MQISPLDAPSQGPATRSRTGSADCRAGDGHSPHLITSLLQCTGRHSRAGCGDCAYKPSCAARFAAATREHNQISPHDEFTG
jgi:hypothetical protein